MWDVRNVEAILVMAWRRLGISEVRSWVRCILVDDEEEKGIEMGLKCGRVLGH